MSNFAIGTQVELVFRTQFVTFTPEQFIRAVKERNYIEVRQQLLDPNGQPITLQTFSKGVTTVFLPPGSPPSPIVFRIINTVNLETVYKEVSEMLMAMNIYPDIASSASFSCTTRVKGQTHPIERLTSLADKSFVQRMSKKLGVPMKVSSVTFCSSFPLKQEGGYDVTLEPLMTNADEEYFLRIHFLTHKMDEFNKFISEFGSDMIQKIIGEGKP
jgi:hypothetical protein